MIEREKMDVHSFLEEDWLYGATRSKNAYHSQQLKHYMLLKQ